MNKLEKSSLKVGILAAVLIAVVHFMLNPEAVEEPSRPKVPEAGFFADFVTYDIPEVKRMDVEIEQVEAKSLSAEEIAIEDPASARAFGARNKEVRLILAKLYGGGEDTENAVEMALDYLARIQQGDGSWSTTNQIGSTGLSLNSFLGAGYSHIDGKHKDTVARGLNWLMSKQKDDGNVVAENHYSTAIAGVVFCEAYGLTGDEKCKEAAERTINYLVRVQGPKGGWAYQPWSQQNDQVDTSVTGWVMMVFKSAKMAGLKVPKETVERYFDYAKLVTDPQNGTAHYGIRNGKVQEKHRYTMTASTLMCRLYMGADLTSPMIKEGLEYITKGLPEETDKSKDNKSKRPVWRDEKRSMDNYMWYHAAQVGFLTSGKIWQFWNEKLRKILTKNQIQSGDRKGAWPDENFLWCERSSVYATCMNVFILQTYYRYYK